MFQALVQRLGAEGIDAARAQAIVAEIIADPIKPESAAELLFKE